MKKNNAVVVSKDLSKKNKKDFIRNVNKTTNDPVEKKKEYRRDITKLEFWEFLEKNYLKDELTLIMASEELGCSVDCINKLSHKYFKMPFKKTRMAFKIYKCIEKIFNGKNNIWVEGGFGTVTTFCRELKIFTGMTKNDLKEKIKYMTIEEKADFKLKIYKSIWKIDNINELPIKINKI